MKIGALYSGGKDSTFAILKAKEDGHDIACLISLLPKSDESMLFHYPNNRIIKYQAEAMMLPLIEFPVADLSRESENLALANSIRKAISLYGIEGIVNGGITSEFQRRAFENTCLQQNIKLISPLWQLEARFFMDELLDKHFEVIIVSISAWGLGSEWLGKKLDKKSLQELIQLSEKYRFNLNFEGGEAETLVTDCPLFAKRIEVLKAKTTWDGQRGMFEILEVALVNKAE